MIVGKKLDIQLLNSYKNHKDWKNWKKGFKPFQGPLMSQRRHKRTKILK